MLELRGAFVCLSRVDREEVFLLSNRTGGICCFQCGETLDTQGGLQIFAAGAGVTAVHFGSGNRTIIVMIARSREMGDNHSKDGDLTRLQRKFLNHLTPLSREIVLQSDRRAD